MKNEKNDFDKLPPECDVLCQWRTCLHKGYNKGPYVPGKGYTSYYDEPEYVCMTRHRQGCPSSPSKKQVDGLEGHLPLRITPDWEKMFEQLQEQITNTTCSSKVRIIMRTMLRILRKVVSYYI